MNMVNSRKRINRLDKHDNCKATMQIHAGIPESNNMQDQIDQMVGDTYPQNVDLIKDIIMDKNKQDPVLIQRISDFVDQLCLEHEHDEQSSPPNQQRLKSAVTAPGFEEAQKHADRTIIEAEKFKAVVEALAGRQNFANNFQLLVGETVPGEQVMNMQGKLLSAARQQIGMGFSDDDFFHLTCHIEPSLQLKIESGKYVDLDKLLPKDKVDHNQQYNNETKLEWVQSEGSTYLVPAKKVSKINCFCRWEQAFRMYATIYCSKNPNRSREIWQYISVINTASMAYNWDNVYGYDIIFRQLMEFNPSRSWAVTYNQM